MNTQELRDHFLIQGLMQPGTVQLVYSHYDRLIIGGAVPASAAISLPNEEELKANFFLERREMGIINVGAAGIVLADGKEYAVDKLDCVYLGKGTKTVKFKSKSKNDPALFYILSAPAHHKYPNRLMKREKASIGEPGRWFDLQ
jgi:4-deoxy-L-threo-5-hexosulose-uronate ketol-isomerase